MKTVYLNNFMSSVVTELERNGQYSTAHVCGSVLRSVMTFDGDGLLLSGITPLWLKAYEHYLLHKGEKGLEWNTISTYMRMLRAVYNRAVVRKLVPFVPHLFREVFTGRKADHRRVLERDDMRQLLAEKDLDIISPGMEWARACLELMFRFHGMPFVDLAHLRKSDLKDGYLTLRRRKTGMPRVWIVELCSCWSATGTGTILRLIYFVFWMEVWKEWLLTGITCGYYACLTVNCVRLPCGGKYRVK